MPYASVFVRFIAALCAFALLAGGVYLAQTYYGSQYATLSFDPEAQRALLATLLDSILILGFAGSFLAALVLYLILSYRVSASTLAVAMTEDLVYSREQFKRFYDLSPVPYLLVNENGNIDRPNKATLRYFGKIEAELVGVDLFTLLVSPEKPQQLAMARQRLGRRIPIDSLECMATRKGGKTTWVLLSIGDITTPGGVHTGLVTLIDIHEQKELERMKTEFLSLTSHQLRAPLANLKWYIDFLLHRRTAELTEGVKQYLERMNERNEDMIGLVNTLLNMSRVEMGRLKVEKEPADLAQLVSSVLDELGAEAERKHISVTRAFPESLPLQSDPRLLRIIVQNLVSNAFRYTPDGGSVSLTTAETRSEVTLAVKDSGIGVPPEEQAKIFSKMYRAENARKMEANGNGIGLYMCKALAEGLGGSLSFTSEVGKGSVFTVVVPKG